MKRFFLLLAAAFGLASTLPAAAQQYAATTQSITNWVGAASTNSNAGTITVTKHDISALQVAFKLMGAGTSAVVVKLYESVDGETYDDTAVSSLSVTAAGTTTVAGVLPITSTAVGYYKIAIENPNANAVTNAVFKLGTKPKRQG